MPAQFTLLIRAWVPESPHWLMTRGGPAEARQSLARALGSAYGIGGPGKIIGPVGLALIVGRPTSQNRT